ncbi:MAG: hypothetical protein SH848_12945 [Saprospiraceae bacterium]|nr:hypothetical protein [Saprospiraceae bacterium]
MDGTKLMQQFKALSDQDLAAFRKYLAINGHQQLQSLFEYLLKHRTEPASVFEKKRVFEHLFSKEKAAYNDVRLRNVMARLSQQIEAFLIETELAEDEGLKRQLLIRAYQKRNAYLQFRTEILARLRKLEQKKERSIEYFRECATLHHHLFFHPDTKGNFKPGEEQYQQLVRSFESWFALGMLSYQSDFLVREMVLNEKNPSQFIEIALSKINQLIEVRDNPVADVLIHICKLPASGLVFEDIEKVYERYQRASPHMGTFERNVASKALISKINILVAATGDVRFFSLLFHLYKDGLQAGMYMEQGNMNVHVFTGIAITGATVGDFNWTETFIETNGPNIEEKERKDAVLLAQAYLNYNLGKKTIKNKAGSYFQKAMTALLNIQHGQPDYELRVRSLQLRICYEYHLMIEKDDQLLTDFSKNFRQYLHSKDNRLAQSRMQAYQDFIHYTLKLARLRAPNVKNPLEKLEKTILAMQNKSSQMMMRHWLMEKAEELKKLLR